MAVLREMLIEVAKWCYLRDHPERKRSPRGFTDGVALKLSGVGEGSAAPQLSLVIERTQLFSPAQIYLEQTRARLIDAIDATKHDKPIIQHLSDPLLAYFDRIGRGLRNDEAS